MNQSKEVTIKKIQQVKNTSEISIMIDKELLKLSKNKADEKTIAKFLKELKSELVKINAMDVNSIEWDNIKNARMYLNSLIVPGNTAKP